MGWGRYLLLGDLGQQLDLSDQRSEIDRLRSEIRQSRSASPDQSRQLEELQADNEELRLYLAAVVRILVSRGVVTAEEIKQLVEAIDAQDGSVDGKYSGDIG